jgi:hypothetical protein
MQRRQVLIAVLGLIAAATAVRADVPKEVTILGQKYALEVHSLGGKYKNGLSVTLAPEDQTGRQGAHIRFVEGATPEQDRMFVVHTPQQLDDVIASAFYMLTGTDANGVFNQATSNLTEFFGGASDFNRHGRPATVTWISDVDTGKKMDRNIALTIFVDPDSVIYYDLDTLTGDFLGDAVLTKVIPSVAADEADPGMPNGGFHTGALGPGGTVIWAGRGQGEGPQIGIMDPTKDTFFDALTNLATATEDQTTPIDFADDAQDFERLSDNEYYLLVATPTGQGEKTREVLYHLRITPPADLAAAEPQSIQVQVLGAEELVNLDEEKDLLGAGFEGVIDMAVGRQVAPNAPRRLYFATVDGRLVTANPVAPAAGP